MILSTQPTSNLDRVPRFAQFESLCRKKRAMVNFCSRSFVQASKLESVGKFRTKSLWIFVMSGTVSSQIRSNPSPSVCSRREDLDSVWDSPILVFEGRFRIFHNDSTKRRFPVRAHQPVHRRVRARVRSRPRSCLYPVRSSSQRSILYRWSR